MPEVTLEPAGPERRQTLANLFQLYVHDFSEQWAGTERGELGEDGLFEDSPGPDAYRTEPDPAIRSLLVEVAWQLRSHSSFDLLGEALQDPAPEVWRQAREHYLDHCAVCHGRDAKGHTEMGANMYPKVPDLTSTEVQRRSDGALFYIIQNGIRWTGMPAWKNEHSPEDTWKLVAFIRKSPTLAEADMKIEEPVAATGERPVKEAPPHRHRH